uniref:autotransporter assembly complex protein TamA n=1 Tax=Paenirhodobacter enshiensis TaxID=1105367 RepID=UPI0035B4E6B7
MTVRRTWATALVCALAGAATVGGAMAGDNATGDKPAPSAPKEPAPRGLVAFSAPGADEDLARQLGDVSLVRAAGAAKTPNPQDLFTSARADYARLLGVLYSEGYYSGVITIHIDGKEAADIQPMDAPETIHAIDVNVTPGPRFHFVRAGVTPLAAGTALPADYAEGRIARSGAILDAASAGVARWKEEGHAKATVADKRIVADHRKNTVDSVIVLDPGPVVHFGDLKATGNKKLRTDRLLAIAGFPTGKKYTPERLAEVQTRLRRTGIFSSVTLTEAERLRAGDVLDYDLAVAEDKPRRMGAGAEIGTSDGLALTGYWMNRNLWGGGERLRIDADIKGIGGSNSAGATDYSIGARIDRPATLSPDTSAYVLTKAYKTTEEDYTEWGSQIGGGLTHVFSDRLTGESGTAYIWSKVKDDYGDTIFRQIAFPNSLTWDNRDDKTDAKRGYYGLLRATPFYGLGQTTGSGMQLVADFRAYKALGTEERLVLAGRGQFGAVYGPSLGRTPRSYLFYSGGGGTVRGQPYQSLGVNELYDGQLKTGGMQFIGYTGEARYGLTDKVGLVAFYDAGFISSNDLFGRDGEWQSGAGLGLRYKTPIGPIRLDVAAPVQGSTGGGVQLYLGIGQAF